MRVSLTCTGEVFRDVNLTELPRVDDEIVMMVQEEEKSFLVSNVQWMFDTPGGEGPDGVRVYIKMVRSD